jgi:hypothetical protein
MAIEPTSLQELLNYWKITDISIRKKPQDKREVIIKLTDKGLNSRNLSKEVVVNFNKR